MDAVMAEPRSIDIARDFSRTPGGRYRREGRFSGEEFREDVLEPAVRRLEKGETLEVNLDSPRGLSSSFLDEAFGGLVEKFSLAFVDERIRLVAATRPLRLERARYHMNRAENRRVSDKKSGRS